MDYGKDFFAYALKSNQAWAGYKAHQNPDFFPTLARLPQSPQILWLGCSDSRCPETTILGLELGDVFAHRNIANIISPTDINTAAVIQYAVENLKVKHVVLCGHSACGGAETALSEIRVGGVIDTWLMPLKALYNTHKEELAVIEDKKAQAIRLAELNVEAGVKVLLANMSINEAINKQKLQVHGVLFDIGSGRIRDLGVGTVKGGHKKGIGGQDAEIV
ncbi:carbonic anhydrase [Nemania sp. NC0429]|nr:carbonic anhydrase [Nemania sp. NC0429]